MKLINTTEAVGHVICHDITRIVKDVAKETVFRKGHIVTEEDIPVLLSIGKDHLYIWEKTEGILHENEAAEILYEICKNEHMTPSEIKEGKIDILASIDGLFKADKKRLRQINSLGEIMIATRHGDFPVKKGDKLAGTRVIPLVIEEKKLNLAKEIAGKEPILQILPFVNKKAGIVTTGNEVFYGRIKDAFGPVIRDKLSEYSVEVLGQSIVNDDTDKITGAILTFIEEGADFIICTGGMSVDPDDTTPTAIKNTGAELISYGAPVLPGAMFLLSYYKGTIPVIGLPGCVMYSRRTIFDLVLPRIMANDRITNEDLANLGHGGLCLNCEVCTFPNCGFGK
ncbi:molybdopterin-binding protein [Anaerocolumna sp. AGMB13025]|uniref:molybdopterin-binding protein n=1 Tax=Anaerocolumna sp. AGMB13025 TaxID=3039116 RepID=UPI00241BED6D|nr:molybdopterin-binding protein [Anaerocolumna sp. AGMB13025]WFR57937.1 molybdopterin-binding protein [Anaerocolumna sp. AGMB13025]